MRKTFYLIKIFSKNSVETIYPISNGPFSEAEVSDEMARLKTSDEGTPVVTIEVVTASDNPILFCHPSN